MPFWVQVSLAALFFVAGGALTIAATVLIGGGVSAYQNRRARKRDAMRQRAEGLRRAALVVYDDGTCQTVFEAEAVLREPAALDPDFAEWWCDLETQAQGRYSRAEALRLFRLREHADIGWRPEAEQASEAVDGQTEHKGEN